MDLHAVIHNAASWLAGAQDERGMVVSCRARLARNIRSVPFAPTAADQDRSRVIDGVLEAARHSHQLREAMFVDMDGLDGNQRRVLVERHLISPGLAEGRGPRGVLFNRDESLSAMVNEEDHLRLQAIVSGLQPEAAWRCVSALDDDLGQRLEYAHHARWGYLTACPTNTGTGLRISVLIHLPALVLSEDMERVVRGLTQLSFSVRGFYGEGSNAQGNLFQLSNQVTLGRPEAELVAELERIARHLIRIEQDAQEELLRNAGAQLEDKVWRAYGLLAHARVLSSKEFMNLLSAVRLGCTLQIIDSVPSSFLNQLMIVTQPAHLQAETGGELAAAERDVQRAAMVRRRLAEQCQGGAGRGRRP